MADLERLTVLIEANTRQITRQLKTLERDIDKSMRTSARSVNTLNASLAAATRTAKTFAGAFGLGFLTGGLAQIPGAMRDVVKSVADMADAADRIGITTDRLQELQFQAEQTGSSTEAMTDALQQFSKRLGEARTGSGELFERLRANGVTLEQIAKMPVNQALEIFINLIGNATDEAQALAIAAEGFGRSGADLALTFADGTTAAQAFAAQAHKTGQVIDNELIPGIQELDDQLAQYWGTLEKLVKTEVLIFFQQTAAGIDLVNRAIESFKKMAAGGGPYITSRGDPDRQKDDLIDPVMDRINQAFSDASLESAGAATPTRDPIKKSKERKAAIDREAAAIEREKEKVVELIAELEREQSLIGATDVQRRISNELRDAGAVATEAQKQQITALVIAIEAEEKAQEKLIDTLDEIRSASGSALDAFTQSIRDGESALAGLKSALLDVLDTIIQIAQQKIITSLLGSFGSAGTGILGGMVAPTIGSVAPHKAAAPAPTNIHITADPSPYLHLTIDKKSRDAEERAIHRGPSVMRNNNMRYAIP